jgi:hypothetical protein
MNNFKVTEHIGLSDLTRQPFDELLNSVRDSATRGHINSIIEYIATRSDEAVKFTIVRNQDDSIAAVSCYRTKFKGKSSATCVLYNIFSLTPGAGSIAFDSYWKYAVETSHWFKFFVFRGAHKFYSKYNVKYWGASKTGQTFSSLGRIYNKDAKLSMNQWNESFNDLDLLDRTYLESNLKVFEDKHKFGILKLKDPHRQVLLDNLLIYKPKVIRLEF